MPNPRLRFKKADGTDYPDWEEKKLNEQADFLQGLTYSPDDVSKNGTLVLRSSNIQNDVISHEDEVYVNIDIPNKLKVKENDILMCVRNGSKNLVGKTALITSKEIGSSWGAFMMIIRPKCNIFFIYQYFKTNLFRKQIFNDLGTATINQITKNNLNRCKLFIPCLEEQEKIANCLSSFDDLISIFSKELKNLEELKKGVMQKIFSQEVRFKKADGINYPDWEEKCFSDVFDCFEYGLNASATKYDGKNKYIRITDIDEEARTYSYNDVVSPNCELEDKYLVKENDILFARTGASVGKTYLYQKSDGILYFAGFLIRGHVNSKFDSRFIFQSTLSEEFKIWIKVNSVRTGQPGINSQQYASYKLQIPCLEEQEKIADCLSAFDEAIKIKKEQIKTAKDLKKGLLQQMFT